MLPVAEKFPVLFACFVGIARKGIGARQAITGKHRNRIADHDSLMIEELLKFSCRFGASADRQIRLTPEHVGIEGAQERCQAIGHSSSYGLAASVAEGFAGLRSSDRMRGYRQIAKPNGCLQEFALSSAYRTGQSRITNRRGSNGRSIFCSRFWAEPVVSCFAPAHCAEGLA